MNDREIEEHIQQKWALRIGRREKGSEGLLREKLDDCSMKHPLQNTTPATGSLDSTPHLLQGSRGRLEGVLNGAGHMGAWWGPHTLGW